MAGNGSTQNVLTGSVRDRMLARYAAAGQKARATTQPYKSRLPWQFNVVNPCNSLAVPTVAAAVLPKGTSQDYFSFGQQSQQIVWTPTFNKQVTGAATNQSVGHATNGVMD